MKTICGLTCDTCWMKDQCAGCTETNAHPFGGSCILGQCCQSKTCPNCGHAYENNRKDCPLIQNLVAEFNALGIPDMEPVTTLNALHGAYINLTYHLPGGDIRFWDDSRMYLGNQMQKLGSDRYYGLTVDENYLLVCEYGEDGAEAEIVVFKRRK